MSVGAHLPIGLPDPDSRSGSRAHTSESEAAVSAIYARAAYEAILPTIMGISFLNMLGCIPGFGGLLDVFILKQVFVLFAGLLILDVGPIARLAIRFNVNHPIVGLLAVAPASNLGSLIYNLIAPDSLIALIINVGRLEGNFSSFLLGVLPFLESIGQADNVILTIYENAFQTALVGIESALQCSDPESPGYQNLVQQQTVLNSIIGNVTLEDLQAVATALSVGNPIQLLSQLLDPMNGQVMLAIIIQALANL